ncbi:UDP-N-acetylglucosamine 2-epimerase [Ramlibacter sp. PS3R-8]|uniref:UDP-N-acetylglucosamine 2-epimerase n=1 Tax=Ramlibacter sp. PS3R-8 TaxID=3133437 RepID=UPI0030992DAB
MKRRRICYVSGTRADFGLMRSTLQAIHSHPQLALEIVATGMHLSQAHGQTLREIEASGLPIRATVPVETDPPTGATMARNIGQMLVAFTALWQEQRPDVVLLLGDRGEMLAGALAAIHLNIPVAHVHGGERSGTVDEPVRHAITKLAHLHFTASPGARERVVRMGEAPDRVWVTGAPGLDGLAALATRPRAELAREAGFDPDRPIALFVFHPVLQEADAAGAQAAAILDALAAQGLQVLALLPNADAGSQAVRTVLQQRSQAGELRLATHLPRADFASWMAAADVLVGNSSAGIIEAATFGTPVVDIGQRQHQRERNANVIGCDADAPAVAAAVRQALGHGRFPADNVYGDGASGPRIVQLLATVPLDAALMKKTNAY